MLWYRGGTGYFLRRSLPWDAIHGMDGKACPAGNPNDTVLYRNRLQVLRSTDSTVHVTTTKIGDAKCRAPRGCDGGVAGGDGLATLLN